MSINFTFRGLMAPVFTPFHDNKERSLKLDIIPEYASYLQKNGIDGILVNGTTGEGVSQTVEEREKVLEAWVSAAADTNQTVMVQIGGTNLKDVCRLARHAEQVGAGGLLCLADLFHHPTNADELLDYLFVVHSAAPKTPLLYYHIPEFTGIDINVVEMLEKADRVPTLVGLKFTNTNLEVGSQCLSVKGGKYVVFLGSDTIFNAALAMGFDSNIGTTLNLFPQLNRTIVEAVKTSNVPKALEAQKALTSAVHAITRHGTWVGTMKSAMNLLSPFNFGPVRDPLKMLDDKQIAQLKNELKSIKPSIF